MQAKKTQDQFIDSSNLYFDKITSESQKNILSNYLEKIKSQDIKQVKLYLGMAYFVLFSVVSLSLLF